MLNLMAVTCSYYSNPIFIIYVIEGTLCDVGEHKQAIAQLCGESSPPENLIALRFVS